MEARRTYCRRPWVCRTSSWLLILAMGVSLWMSADACAEEDASPPSTSSRSSHPSRVGDPGGESTAIEAKLNKILDNQQRILARLDEVMEELGVIKVRATVR